MTGNLLSGSMKLSSSALPSALSPVMRMTYLGLSSARSGGVDNGRAHALGVVNVFAEDDGLVEGIGGRRILHDPLGDQFRALIQHENAVHVFLVVFALLDFLAKVISHARRGVQPSMSLSISMRTTLYTAQGIRLRSPA